MKRILFLTCIGSLALALTALGAPNKPATKSAKRTVNAPAVTMKGGGHSMSHAAPVRTSRSYSAARMRTTPTVRNSATMYPRDRSINRENKTLRSSRVNTLRNSQMEAARTNKANARFANANARTSAAVNRGTNIKGTTNQLAAPQRNATVVNNWQNVSGQNYTAFRDYRRQRHDRSWWRNHYSRIILVGGGWWFWDSGYWYPAWGYDPYYTYYPYDGPIYGYNDLTPDQVIVNVQRELRNDGYYTGPVDGVLGRQTRRAIAAFQADHGLAVTSAVDQPTLATLGLT